MKITYTCPRCGKTKTVNRQKTQRPKTPMCQPCASSLGLTRLYKTSDWATHEEVNDFLGARR